MAIGKPRGKLGMRCVFVYDKRVGKKRYVGSRKNLRGPGGAQELEREKQAEFAQRNPTDGLTVRTYATEWLDIHHGPGTRRPAPGTHDHNRLMLNAFLGHYGDRKLDGGIQRRDALAWARKHQHAAKAVAAMFNDAVDDEACKANPFANRRQEQAPGRSEIHPLTGEEIDRLASIALRHWGEDGYGVVARAWILFSAWVGTRPGETFSVQQADLDFHNGEVTIRRVKRRGRDYPTDVIVFPRVAQDAVCAIPNLPAVGPVFPTVTGKPMQKGGLRYHWDPVRAAFKQTVTPARWAELLQGQSEKRDLDLYSCRHHCASQMADAGLSGFDIAAQLGNSPEVCRSTYIHSYRDATNDRVRRALEGTTVVDMDAVRARRGA